VDEWRKPHGSNALGILVTHAPSTKAPHGAGRDGATAPTSGGRRVPFPASRVPPTVAHDRSDATGLLYLPVVIDHCRGDGGIGRRACLRSTYRKV
jgi:hypothetical protein